MTPRARRRPSGSARRSGVRERPRGAGARASRSRRGVLARPPPSRRSRSLRRRRTDRAGVSRSDRASTSTARRRRRSRPSSPASPSRLRRASPGGRRVSRRFAITPSRPIASKRSSQPSASSRSRVAGESSNRFALRSRRDRRFESGSCHASTPFHTRTSKAMNRAGISAESLFTRLSAGWRRICIASKSRTPSRSMTISPSSAESGGRSFSSGRSSGKYRRSGRALRDQRRSSPEPFSRRPRKPSHFGSYCHSSPSGSSRTSSASIGGNGIDACRSAGRSTGSRGPMRDRAMA